MSESANIPESNPASDLIRNTQSGRRDADDVRSTPVGSGGGTDTGITGNDGPGGGLTGPGSGAPDVAAEGTGGPGSGTD